MSNMASFSKDKISLQDFFKGKNELKHPHPLLHMLE